MAIYQANLQLGRHAANPAVPTPLRTVARRRPEHVGSGPRGWTIQPSPPSRLKPASLLMKRTDRLAMHAGGQFDLGDLDLEVPDVADDLASFQEKLGAIFDENGVAVSFGKEHDRKAAQAWQYGVVLVDRSHWGRLRMVGADRLNFLHAQSTNDISRLQPGQGCHTVFVTATGRTLDLALVLAQGRGCLVITSPGMDTLLQQRMTKYIFPADDVQVSNVGPHTKMFTLMGPEAHALVKEWGGDDGEALVAMAPGRHVVRKFNDNPVVVVASSGMGPAVPGWTFILQEMDAADFWRKIALKGALPMGSAVWDDVRIRLGVPVPGRELTDLTNPLEAGLYHAVSLTKGCYIGQETLSKVYIHDGVKQQLWGLRLREGAPCDAGDDVLDGDGRKRGKVTSVARADEAVALAYLKCREQGKQIPLEGMQVSVRGEPAKVQAISHAVRELADDPRVSNQVEQTATAADEEALGKAEAKAEKLRAMQERLAAFQATGRSDDRL